MNPPKLLVLLLSLAAAGCGSAARAPAGASTSKEFQELLDTSVKELQVKTAAHESWGLGKFERWNVDQDAGTLVFSNADGTKATTTAQIIGSFSTSDDSWLWAWDNPSVDDKLKADALKVKAYGEEHGIERLTTRKWTGTEERLGYGRPGRQTLQQRGSLSHPHRQGLRLHHVQGHQD